jgi:hypothetical protein
MDRNERKALKALPDDIAVQGFNVDGLCWTLVRQMAIWFARRSPAPEVLLTGRAKKSHVHALLLGRKESEVVLDEVEITATEHVGHADPSP